MVRSHRAFFPLFDSLRGIAALSVVLFHLKNYAGSSHLLQPYLGRMDLGVTIFFLISGFLLYRPFVAASLNGGRPVASGAYAWRRLLRIVPGYWLALTGAALLLSQRDIFHWHGLLYYGFAQIYTPRTALGGIAQAWSLNVEITFYALLPLWALMMVRLPAKDDRGRVRNEVIALAAMFAFSLGYKVVLFSSNTPLRSPVWHFILPRDLDLFALGMVLAVASVWYEHRPRPDVLKAFEEFPVIAVAISVAAFWYVSIKIGLRGTLFERFSNGQALEEHYLYALIALGLLVPAVFGRPGQGVVRRVLGNRLLLWLGVISYGLYLWHLTILMKLQQGSLIPDLASDLHVAEWIVWSVVGIGGSVLVAAASYYLVERHALKLKSVTVPRSRQLNARWRRSSTSAAILASIGLLAAGALVGTGYATADVALALAAAAAAVLLFREGRRFVGRLIPPHYLLVGIGGLALLFVIARFALGPPQNAAANLPYQQNAYLVATYGPGGVRLFVNGHLAARAKATRPPDRTGSPLEIGSLDGASGWIGTIDDAAVYDRQLDGRTVLRHLKAGLARSGYAAEVESTAGLLHFWRLGDSGATAADAANGAPATFAHGVTQGALGITDKSDGAAASDGRHGIAVARDTGMDRLSSFSVEAWVTVQREGNRAVFGKRGSFFLKTDFLGRWLAGYLTGGKLVSATTRSAAVHPPKTKAKALPAKSSVAAPVLGLLGAACLAGLAVALCWPPDWLRGRGRLRLRLSRKRTAA